MSKIIIYIMLIFMVIGGIDKIIGNRLGLGEKFDEGFKTMGPLAIAMLGIYCLAPVLGKGLIIITKSIYNLLGIDPSVFAGAFLACDMGGYNISMQIAKSHEIGLFSGLILASMLGTTIVFTIPIAISIINKEDQEHFGKGILIGIITIPIGLLIGGLMCGLSVVEIFSNIIPIIILVIILSISIIKNFEKTIKVFDCLGKAIVATSILGLIFSALQMTTGKVVISGMIPLEEGFKVVGSIAIILSGAFPLLHVITILFQKPLSKLGSKIDIEEKTMEGIIAALASNIPTFVMLKDMDNRGKVICSAFAVSGAFTFGGQLGFVSGVEKNMVGAFIIGKLVGGISAIILAYFLTQEDLEKNKKLKSCLG